MKQGSRKTETVFIDGQLPTPRIPQWRPTSSEGKQRRKQRSSSGPINKQMRSLRPSHVVDRGGAAHQYRVSQILKGERHYHGPSHVVEGDGDSLRKCLRDIPIRPIRCDEQEFRSTRMQRFIIIIHLLGLAPAGYLTAPDNGPEGRLWGGASQRMQRSL
jgi:hypothetical protein